MQAKRDLTNGFSKMSNPDQLEGDKAISICGTMKGVSCSKTGKMGLDKTGSSSLMVQKNGRG